MPRKQPIRVIFSAKVYNHKGKLVKQWKNCTGKIDRRSLSYSHAENLAEVRQWDKDVVVIVDGTKERHHAPSWALRELEG